MADGANDSGNGATLDEESEQRRLDSVEEYPAYLRESDPYYE